MDRQEIITKAAAWMQPQRCKEKLAKRRGYEQSLFEHGLIEVNVFFELLPILANPGHYGLTCCFMPGAQKWDPREALKRFSDEFGAE